MDDKNENQDLVINSDGSMDSGDQGAPITINVKTDDIQEINGDLPGAENPTDETSSQPEFNETLPPPDMEITVDPPPASEVGPIEVTHDATSESSQMREVREAPEDTQDLPAEPSAQSSNIPSAFDSPDQFSVGPSINDSEPAAVGQNMNTASHNDKPQEHRNNKKIAALVIIILAFILAGATVYVFLSAQNNTKESKNNALTSQKEDLTPSSQELSDQINGQVDEAVKSIDDTEISDDTLSDQSLGIQ